MILTDVSIVLAAKLSFWVFELMSQFFPCDILTKLQIRSRLDLHLQIWLWPDLELANPVQPYFKCIHVEWSLASLRNLTHNNLKHLQKLKS